MNELNRTTRLIIASVLLLAVLVIGMLTVKKPALVYKLSSEATLKALKDTSGLISLGELKTLQAGSKSNIILIDIRNHEEYERACFDKAVNIPVRELLKSKNLSFLKEMTKKGSMLVLYGNDQLEANGPWMMLRQLGFDKVKILQGGHQAASGRISDATKDLPLYVMEVSHIDTALIRKHPDLAEKEVPKAVQKKQAKKIVPVKQAPSSGGGC